MASKARHFDVFQRALFATFAQFFLGIAISVEAQTVLPLPSDLRNVAGDVHAIAVQADGKIIIGGDFTAIGNIPRHDLARLNSDGSVDLGWNPEPDNEVDALAISGNILYVGGYFQNIGGQPRSGVAAIDEASGTATAWNPGADAGFGVFALAVSGSSVYAGGDFSHIGGQMRSYIAAIDSSSGSATAWNPNADSPVTVLAVSGNSVYAAGFFTSIGGQTRNHLAALDATTGLATPWNPAPNAYWVRALALSGSVVYVGGTFTTIGGQTRNHLAALDATTGLATSWNPAPDGEVSALMLSGTTLFAGGGFTNIGGQPRSHVALLDTSTGLATSWSPALDNPQQAGNEVHAFGLSGNILFVGGFFQHVDGNLTGGLAQTDASTGAVTPTQMFNTPVVYAIQAQDDGKVIIGGEFTSVENVARMNIARLNADGSVDSSWNPGADYDVTVVAVGNGSVYAAGGFFTIGGQSRHGIAALDSTSGLATSWNPSPDVYPNSISSLAVSGTNVYTAGGFGNIGGQPRNGLAAIDSASGLATSWNPGADGGSTAVAIKGNTVYVSGVFSNIGGQARSGLAALDATSGLATSWNPGLGAGGAGLSIVPSGSRVYVGGFFSSIGGQPSNGLAAVDAATGAITSWNPGFSYGGQVGGQVNTIVVSGSEVYVGGYFTTVGGQPRSNVAAIDASTGLAKWDSATDWNPGPDSFVQALAISGDAVYVGGSFASIAGQPHGGIAALTPSDEISHGDFESGPTPVNFALGADDYGSLTIGGLPVCTYDNVAAGGGCSGAVNMLPGAWYDIAIDYKNRAGSDGMSLTWDQPSGPAVVGYGFTGSYPNLVPLANFRTLDASNNYVSGLRGDYYDLSGGFQSTVFGEGPIDAANNIYNNQATGSWNGYGYFSLFEERLSGQIQLP